MNFDGRDDDRAGKQKQCSAENLPIFQASFVKVSIFLIILSRHHLLNIAASHRRYNSNFLANAPFRWKFFAQDTFMQSFLVPGTS